MSKSLKVAILAEDKPGFILPMSHGLAKMLTELGITSKVFTQGLAHLDFQPHGQWKKRAKNWLKHGVNTLTNQHYFVEPLFTAQQQQAFVSALSQFDLVVVVCPIPRAFLAAELKLLDQLRQQLKLPFVLYQNYYLATRGAWYQKIKAQQGFGLERFDWYLAASVVSEYGLQGEQHPVSLIGHDLRHSQLSCNFDQKQQQPFKLLLDFARPGFESYRQLQLEALQRTNTAYTELKGLYSQAQIRTLYREHHGLMLSFRESFGLPIVENQLCGNWIFTPAAHWVPSHFINKSLAASGEGQLGSNFIVYDDDLELLCQAIERAKQMVPSQNLAHFTTQYPQLFHGDLEQLGGFCAKVANGSIDSNSHLSYQGLNKTIISDDK